VPKLIAQWMLERALAMEDKSNRLVAEIAPQNLDVILMAFGQRRVGLFPAPSPIAAVCVAAKDLIDHGRTPRRRPVR
jgi:hypothetical protein